MAETFPGFAPFQFSSNSPLGSRLSLTSPVLRGMLDAGRCSGWSKVLPVQLARGSAVISAVMQKRLLQQSHPVLSPACVMLHRVHHVPL